MVYRIGYHMEATVRFGFTLLELILALVVISFLTAMAVPGIGRLRDGVAVRSATAEAHALFGTARQLAIHRGTLVTLELDTVAQRILLRAGTGILRARELGEVHGVRIAASRLATVYAANGLGYGASNLTLVIRRGHAADTLTVSRLGRVRRR